MNLLSLLDQLSTPGAPAAAPRRQVLRQLGTAAARSLAAGLPLAVATSPAALARTNDTLLDALIVLLKLEDLQVAFYQQALAAPAFATVSFRSDLVLMHGHQQGHAAFLRENLRRAGVAAPTAPTFDFSGQRGSTANPVLFPDVFTNVANFLELAMQLEDAAAAIYKGQASFIVGNRLLMDAIVRMHSVEARHASHVRTLRRTSASSVRVKSWPSRADAAPNAPVRIPSLPATTPASTTTIYAVEANETQILSGSRLAPFATVLTGANVVQSNALAEAFDEPLTTAQATALLAIFG